jgi:hypothetical protein
VGNLKRTSVSAGKPQRIIPPNTPPHAGHPTITGTTVFCPSFVVVIHVFVVRPEIVTP